MKSVSRKDVNLSNISGAPTGLSVDLTFFNKFECNLALPGTAESMQDEDVTFPNIAREICVHLRKNVFSAGEDRCRGRATSQTRATETPASGMVQSTYPGDPSLETVKDMFRFNAHVIGFDMFDMPFSRRANPDAQHVRLVICCVGGVVASMIMITLISQKEVSVTDSFEMPLRQT